MQVANLDLDTVCNIEPYSSHNNNAQLAVCHTDDQHPETHHPTNLAEVEYHQLVDESSSEPTDHTETAQTFGVKNVRKADSLQPFQTSTKRQKTANTRVHKATPMERALELIPVVMMSTRAQYN